MALLTLDDTLYHSAMMMAAAVAHPDSDCEWQGGGVTVEDTVYKSFLRDVAPLSGVDATNRDHLEWIKGHHAGAKELRFVNLKRQGNAQQVVLPETRVLFDSEYAFELAIDAALNNDAATMLLAFFDDSLPSDIHSIAMLHANQDLIEAARKFSPRWVRSWEW